MSITMHKTQVWGIQEAIRGMRNPMNSWERSDSFVKMENGKETFVIPEGGPDDKLMRRLVAGGQPHRKFMRQIFISVDITAPLYWWKQYDTYKIGTTGNSTSTMHRLIYNDFSLSDFSTDYLSNEGKDVLMKVIEHEKKLQKKVLFDKSLSNGEKRLLELEMIQMLPSAFNQLRTETMTYENALTMWIWRRDHKLMEWQTFCNWVSELPYMDRYISAVSSK